MIKGICWSSITWYRFLDQTLTENWGYKNSGFTKDDRFPFQNQWIIFPNPLSNRYLLTCVLVFIFTTSTLFVPKIWNTSWYTSISELCLQYSWGCFEWNLLHLDVNILPLYFWYLFILVLTDHKLAFHTLFKTVSSAFLHCLCTGIIWFHRIGAQLAQKLKYDPSFLK